MNLITFHDGTRRNSNFIHDDVIKWKHFPRNWPFVRGIHRSPVNSTHKGQWRIALMFSLICGRINGWVNNGEVGDLRRYRVHCDVIVMWFVPQNLLLHLIYTYVISYGEYSTRCGQSQRQYNCPPNICRDDISKKQPSGRKIENCYFGMPHRDYMYLANHGRMAFEFGRKYLYGSILYSSRYQKQTLECIDPIHVTDGHRWAD